MYGCGDACIWALTGVSGLPDAAAVSANAAVTPVLAAVAVAVVAAAAVAVVTAVRFAGAG